MIYRCFQLSHGKSIRKLIKGDVPKYTRRMLPAPRFQFGTIGAFARQVDRKLIKEDGATVS